MPWEVTCFTLHLDNNPKVKGKRMQDADIPMTTYPYLSSMSTRQLHSKCKYIRSKLLLFSLSLSQDTCTHTHKSGLGIKQYSYVSGFCCLKKWSLKNTSTLDQNYFCSLSLSLMTHAHQNLALVFSRTVMQKHVTAQRWGLQRAKVDEAGECLKLWGRRTLVAAAFFFRSSLVRGCTPRPCMELSLVRRDTSASTVVLWFNRCAAGTENTPLLRQ